MAQDWSPHNNLRGWVADHQHLLKPPVGNALCRQGCGQLIIMLVGGPNRREDFHINEGAEFFLQLKGDMRLDVMECGVKKEIPIREGEVFVLPPRIPHSPQRDADTVGLVIERKRLEHETDGLRWYVPGTDTVLFQDWFHCVDLGVQLKPVIEAFFASEEYQTKVPKREYNDSPVDVDTTTRTAEPLNLAAWMEQLGAANGAVFQDDSEFTVQVLTQPEEAEYANPGETWVYQLTGPSTLTLRPGASAETVALAEGDTYMVPYNVPHTVAREAGNATIVITNATVAPLEEAEAGAGAAATEESPRKRKLSASAEDGLSTA